MQHPLGFGREEIVDERAILAHRLGTNARFIGKKVVRAKARAIFLALFQVPCFRERTAEFLKDGFSMGEYCFPETGKADDIGSVRKLNERRG